jgi:hypothetical protein
LIELAGALSNDNVPTEFSKALRFQSILVGDEAIFIAKQSPMNLENVTYIGHGVGALAGDGGQLDPVAAEIVALRIA